MMVVFVKIYFMFDQIKDRMLLNIIYTSGIVGYLSFADDETCGLISINYDKRRRIINKTMGCKGLHVNYMQTLQEGNIKAFYP